MTAGPGTAKIFEARDLFLSFGSTPALRGASLGAWPGEIVAVMGPSGSGQLRVPGEPGTGRARRAARGPAARHSRRAGVVVVRADPRLTIPGTFHGLGAGAGPSGPASPVPGRRRADHHR